MVSGRIGKKFIWKGLWILKMIKNQILSRWSKLFSEPCSGYRVLPKPKRFENFKISNGSLRVPNIINVAISIWTSLISIKFEAKIKWINKKQTCRIVLLLWTISPECSKESRGWLMVWSLFKLWATKLPNIVARKVQIMFQTISRFSSRTGPWTSLTFIHCTRCIAL